MKPTTSAFLLTIAALQLFLFVYLLVAIIPRLQYERVSLRTGAGEHQDLPLCAEDKKRLEKALSLRDKDITLR